MKKPEREKIEGFTYEVCPLPAGQGMDLLFDVAKIVGPAIGEALSVPGGLKAILDMNAGSAIKELFDRATKEQLHAITTAFAESTKCEATAGTGKMVQLTSCFDMHFSGNYLAMMKWLAFAWTVNYGPLGEALRAVVASRMKTP